jgi:hypothetical protein
MAAERAHLTMTNETLAGQMRELSGKLRQKDQEFTCAPASMTTQAD